MTHSTAACHREGCQPGTGLRRDIKSLYLAILFSAIPHSFRGPNQCPLFSAICIRLQRREPGVWKPVLAESGDSRRAAETISCGHRVRGSLLLQSGEWRTKIAVAAIWQTQHFWALERASMRLPTRHPQRGPPRLFPRGLRWHPGYFTNHRQTLQLRRGLAAVTGLTG